MSALPINIEKNRSFFLVFLPIHQEASLKITILGNETHQLKDETHQLEDKTHQLKNETHQLKEQLPRELKIKILELGKRERIFKTRLSGKRKLSKSGLYS